MTDFDGPEAPDAERERDRERIEGVKRWVRHIQETRPEVWGPEQNAVVNAQVEAARAAGLDADHLLHVERVARDLAEDDEGMPERRRRLRGEFPRDVGSDAS